MKVAIITIPMKSPDKVSKLQYSYDGNKEIEYENEVSCPVHAVLAKKLKKGEDLKVIYVLTTGKNSSFIENANNFETELNEINSKIGAKIKYDTIEIEFKPTKVTLEKILLELTEKIPNNAEIYADITFGYKPAIISLFCALKFAEEFCDALIEYVVYGKIEFNKNEEKEGPVIFDITSLYYLFNLMGSMKTTDKKTAAKMLKDFFSI